MSFWEFLSLALVLVIAGISLWAYREHLKLKRIKRMLYSMLGEKDETKRNGGGGNSTGY